MTAKTLPAAKGTGSVAKAGKTGRKPKAPDTRTVRVPIERRDADLIAGVIAGLIPASLLVAGPAPVAPVQPSDDGTATEWREYALAMQAFPAKVESHAMQNLAASRISRALANALEGVPLRAPRKSKTSA